MARPAQPLLAHGTRSGRRVLLLLSIILTAGCEKDAPTRTVRVSAYVPAGCAEPQLDPGGVLRLTPLGDFPALTAPIELRLGGAQPLPFPAGTQAVLARAETETAVLTGAVDRTPNSDSVPLLLWPNRSPCRLLESTGFGPSTAIGYSPSARMLLLAGGDSPGSPADSVAAAVFDATSGLSERLGSNGSSPGDGSSLAEPRAFATITPFGSGLLVAGGENPFRIDAALATPSRTAEVFDTTRRRFSSVPIELTVERSRHAATVLASGDTLLVGGRGPSGAALNVLETISPLQGRASIAGLAALEAPRLFPVLLTLDDGRLFVGGGTAIDGTPSAALEWLSGDARTHLEFLVPISFPPRHDRAFAALPGGSVLAVGGCKPTAELAGCPAVCREGCPPDDGADADSEPDYDAFWITPEYEVVPLELPFAAPSPALIAGSDGMPWISGSAGGEPALFRFDPWTTTFEPVFDWQGPLPGGTSRTTALEGQTFAWLAPSPIAPASPASTSESASGADSPETGSSEKGSLEAGSSLIAARFESHHRLASPTDLLHLSDGRPWLVPDRPPRGEVQFSPEGHFLLFSERSQATVYVAGLDYAAFSATLWVEGDAPEVIVGQQSFGGATCPWKKPQAVELRVERHEEQVFLYSDGEITGPCRISAGRARLGFRRANGSLVVRDLRVTRQPS